MKPAYYNEFDPYAAQWLRNLIAAGRIAPGDVDERSITDVRPDDLRGYGQCHFFAGIGGWSVALRLAGIPDDRPVWTGSCPCQPFSAAGKQRGSNDERHLWPAFFDLIRECRPSRVFGEQVAGAAGYAWWDHVAADLESEDYAAAAADIGAHSVGAFHIRQRLYWVAHAGCQRLQQRGRHNLAGPAAGDESQARERQRVWLDAGAGQHAGILGHADPQRPSGRSLTGSGEGMGQPGAQPARAGADGGVGNSGSGRRPGSEPALAGSCATTRREGPAQANGPAGSVPAFGLANTARACDRREEKAADHGGSQSDRPADWAGGRSCALDPWGAVEWLQCSDGKARPTQPGLFPLVDGVRDGRLAVGSALGQGAAALSEAQAQHRFSRVGVLKGAGNAIVPQVAAAFVRAAA